MCSVHRFSILHILRTKSDILESMRQLKTELDECFDTLERQPNFDENAPSVSYDLLTHLNNLRLEVQEILLKNSECDGCSVHRILDEPFYFHPLYLGSRKSRKEFGDHLKTILPTLCSQVNVAMRMGGGDVAESILKECQIYEDVFTRLRR
jgi:hypothetical protein